MAQAHSTAPRALLALLLWLAGAGRVAVNAAEDGPAPNLSAADVVTLSHLLAERQKQEGLPAAEVLKLERLQAVLRHWPVTGHAAAQDREEVEERLKELLRADVATHPESRGPRVALARFYLYLDRPDLAVRHLERAGPGAAENVFWPLLMTYGHLRSGDHARAEKALAQANQAAQALLPLRLRHALFCNHIKTLGQYEPRGTGPLAVGESTWLYIELVGVSFRRRSELQHQLNIDVHLTLRDDLQRTAWERQGYCNLPFVYQHPVHDVYAGVDFIVPDMPAGRYTLIVTCVDRESDQKATADIALAIGAGTVSAP